MRLRVALATALIAILFSTLSFAQDTGVPDTCRFTSGTWIINSQADSVFSVDLWGWLDDPLIRGCALGFRLYTFGSIGYGPHVDSLIIVDTFFFNPSLTAPVQNYQRSILNSLIDPGAADWGYNGLSIGLIDFTAAILPLSTKTRIGTLRLKVLDRERVPEDFTIEVDSSFFPPGGTFKFSRQGGDGFAPKFIKSVITVDNDLTPKLLTITPNTGKQNETLNVTVTGYRTHFGQGSSTVYYFSKGVSTITATSLSIVSPTNMTGSFSIPSGAETGLWNVSVAVDGYATVTKPNGFTINPPFVCGNADGDSGTLPVDIGDIVYLIDFVFREGPSPVPYEAGDVDCDNFVDIDDIVYLIQFIFAGGFEPCHDCP
jgi:hypothetical protein